MSTDVGSSAVEAFAVVVWLALYVLSGAKVLAAFALGVGQLLGWIGSDDVVSVALASIADLNGRPDWIELIFMLVGIVLWLGLGIGVSHEVTLALRARRVRR